MAEKKEVGLVKIEKDNVDELAGIAEEMGLDVDKEIQNQGGSQLAQPFLKVEHDSKEGKHGFYLQFQEGIFDETPIIRLGTREKPVIEVDIQVLLHEPTRSYFPDPTKKMPECASANGKVLGFIEKSYNDGKPTCEGCPLNRFGTDCKPRIRALIGMKYKFEDKDEAIYPFLFYISPTSLSPWNKLTRKLKATKLPVQCFLLHLKLDDIKDANRYAKINFEINRALNQEEIDFGKEAIALLTEAFEQQNEAEISNATGKGEEVKF